jgi:hypothetical protein
MNRTVPISIGAFVILAAIGAIVDRPNPKANERERTCKAWGVTDGFTLARCRESDKQERAAIAPMYKKYG